MDRGAWQAAVHGIARVRHDLVLFFLIVVCIVNSSLPIYLYPTFPTGNLVFV